MLAVDELGDDGVLLGTAKYVAPEQVQGHLVDGRTDLYSLAIVLTECLTGRVPFEGPDERAVALARLSQIPAPVRRSRPDVPVALDELLAAALRPRPSDRPPTAAAFRDALQRIPKTSAASTTDATAALPEDRTRTYPVDPTTTGATPAVAGASAGAPGGAPAAKASSSDGDPPPAPPVVSSDPTPPFGSSKAASRQATDVLLRTNQRAVAWFVAILVAIAVIVSLVILAIARSESSSAAPPGLSAPTSAGAQHPDAVTPTEVATTRAARPPNAMAIVSAGEFDPPPGNGEENPEHIGLLTDGRDDTVWSTVCYRRANMAPKQGVGLVFQLSAPAKGHTLLLTTPTRGFSASVYVASSVGTRLQDWGKPTDKGSDLGPGDVRFDLGDNAGRYVLLWFTVLGQPGCSAMPYQLRLAEVAVVR